MLKFLAVPELGTKLDIDGQCYVLVSTAPYTRKSDGGASILLHWEGRCADCGQTFYATTGLSSNGVNRRCSICSSPLKRVRTKRGRPIIRITPPANAVRPTSLF